MKNLIVSRVAKKCIFVLSLLGSVNSTYSYQLPVVITENKSTIAVIGTLTTVFIGNIIYTQYQEDKKSNQNLITEIENFLTTFDINNLQYKYDWINALRQLEYKEWQIDRRLSRECERERKSLGHLKEHKFDLKNWHWCATARVASENEIQKLKILKEEIEKLIPSVKIKTKKIIN